MVEPNELLSERELEILRLVSTGAANKEIARQLVISPNTVKVHLRNIFTKIGVASRTEAMLYAMQTGLVKADISEEMPLETVSEAIKDAPGTAQASSTTGLPPSKSRHFSGLRSWQIAIVVLSAMTLISIGVFFTMRILKKPAEVQATQVITQPAAQDFAQQRWSEKSSIPTARKGMGFVEYEGALYLIAGETVDGVNGSVLRYTEADNKWKELAHKPTPVTDVQAVVLGEKIYVPGGRMSNGQPTDRLEVYNPRENTWENKAPLPAALSAYALAAFEGDLYLFGGKNGSKYLDIVFYYNTKEDHWVQRASMSAPRAYFAAVPDGGKINVLGGYDGKKVFNLNEAYFPTREESGDTAWERFAPLPQGRYGMGIAHLASLIYLVGGMDENHHFISPSCLMYNSRSNEWAEFDSPPLQTSVYPALIASGNFLYLIGGETPKGLSAANLSYQAIYTISVPILQNK